MFWLARSAKYLAKAASGMVQAGFQERKRHLDLQKPNIPRTMQSLLEAMAPDLRIHWQQGSAACFRQSVSLADGLQLHPRSSSLLTCGDGRSSANGTPHVRVKFATAIHCQNIHSISRSLKLLKTPPPANSGQVLTYFHLDT